VIVCNLALINGYGITKTTIDFHKNGVKKAEGQYIDGKKEGLWISWHRNGERESEGEYIDGQRDGRWREWDPDGKLIKEEYLVDGKLVMKTI